MSAGMPELGSKISLISKADIRYEGRLFTVDPKECTIALASVRSFGTEDRETSYPVPAQNQVYDYILFRGSDIKDIRVVNSVSNVNQPLNDPAIMQLSVPPSLGPQPFQSHPMLGHMGGPPMGQFAAGGYGAMGGATMAASVLDIIAGGSRSNTPASLGSRKSPTNDQGVQAGSSGRRDDKKNVRPIQPPGNHPRNQPQHQQQRKSHSQERRNSRGDGQSYYYQDQRNQNRHPNNSMGRNQNYQGNNYHHNQHQQGGPNQHLQHQQQGGNQQRGGWTNRGQMMRPRGRPRGGGFKPNQGQPTPGNKNKNTLKFENDYDFEQANTEFEELRSQLAKVKVEDGVKPTEVNGDVDKKDDSGNETGAGENEQEEEHEVFYDKTKSFFDKISCEAVERAKGKSQRTDWRIERKLNSETFGVAATRRGNFRGRAGFRGMGYRGGFRGGYRPQQRRDQQQQPQQQQQQHQQQQGAGGPRPQPSQPQQHEENKSNNVQSGVPAAAGGK